MSVLGAMQTTALASAGTRPRCARFSGCTRMKFRSSCSLSTTASSSVTRRPAMMADAVLLSSGSSPWLVR